MAEPFIRKIREEDVAQIHEIEKLCFAMPWSEESILHDVKENVVARWLVLDDGEGMAPEVLDTLYWRALSRSMLGDPRWGVGLGMQLVRQVAIAHGGTVLVERRESGGTCVTVSIERVRGEYLQAPCSPPYTR